MKREFTIPKILIIVLVIYSSLHPQTILSVDTVSTKLFPLKTGNVWVYHYLYYYMNYNQQNLYIQWKTDSTIIIGGHLFYRILSTCKFISGTTQCGSPGYLYYRIDSTTGRIFQYVNGSGCSYMPNYWIQDSLQAKLNDSIRSCEGTFNDHRCIDTSYQIILGISRQIKVFDHQEFEMSDGRKYAKGIGLYFFGASPGFSYWYDTLMGCVINGVVYGDTAFTLADLKRNSYSIPSSYHLYQNYPNPFNPTTKIKFDISPSPSKMERGQGGEVKIIIYDILGREVATLVNEKLAPGTYEVEWNGSNYSSGVYYYKLMITNPETSSGLIFSETKKMVLVK